MSESEPLILKPLGQVFDTSKVELPGKLVSHAQSPQAINTPEGIRVYFSSRKFDDHGLPRATPIFADYTLNFDKLVSISTGEILPNAIVGAFDEHGIFPFSPTAIGANLWAYTTGWSRRRAVSIETGIGLVVSNDGGESFQRVGHGPVMTAEKGEPFLVCDAWVRNFGGIWHMWYLYGVTWIPGEEVDAERVYKIGHATSRDGLDWVRDQSQLQLIPDVLGQDECQALPSVEYFRGKYHMVFAYRDALDFRNGSLQPYQLGYATSKDLKSWQREDDKLQITGEREDWESHSRSYPSFFLSQDEMYLLYNGNDFGKYGFGAAKVL